MCVRVRVHAWHSVSVLPTTNQQIQTFIRCSVGDFMFTVNVSEEQKIKEMMTLMHTKILQRICFHICKLSVYLLYFMLIFFEGKNNKKKKEITQTSDRCDFELFYLHFFCL